MPRETTKQQLSSDKIQQLENIGFQWDFINAKWQQIFEKLCEFKEKYHHCNVPQTFQQDQMLARWVNTQRQAYKKRQLSSDKIQELEALGFQWTVKK